MSVTDPGAGARIPTSESTVVKRGPVRLGRLLGEAAHLVAAAGPGVVPLRGVVRDHDEVELHLAAAAGSLADVLAERGRLHEAETRAVGVAAALALDRLHGAGIVHADVKPSNLLLSHDGELWVADLDAGCAADGRPLRRGTPGRIRPGATATPRTDVVSLAVALVELATGVVPDPALPWDVSDLMAIGCPRALATDLAGVLGAEPGPSARRFADLVGGGRRLPLPEPPTERSGSDPTPTIDFDPVVAPPPRPAVDRNRAEPPPTAALATLAVVVLIVVVVALVA